MVVYFSGPDSQQALLEAGKSAVLRMVVGAYNVAARVYDMDLPPMASRERRDPLAGARPKAPTLPAPGPSCFHQSALRMRIFGGNGNALETRHDCGEVDARLARQTCPTRTRRGRRDDAIDRPVGVLSEDQGKRTLTSRELALRQEIDDAIRRNLERTGDREHHHFGTTTVEGQSIESAHRRCEVTLGGGRDGAPG